MVCCYINYVLGSMECAIDFAFDLTAIIYYHNHLTTFALAIICFHNQLT